MSTDDNQDNLPVKQSAELIALDKKIKLDLQKMTAYFHKAPNPDALIRNKFANNSLFLPISFVEMQLDEAFFGMWQTENFITKLVANEMVGQIDLKIFHPVAKQWITRTGAASVQIQQAAGTAIDQIGEHKIKNTLVKDYPHLKAECVKNAAKSIGKLFGRDLNREHVDNYNPLMTDENDDSIN